MPECASDSLALLCLAADCGSARLYAHLGDPAPDGVAVRFFERLGRRALHEPIQYIAGSWDFMGLAFELNRHTLIPRPDTECLAEHAMRLANSFFPDKLALGALNILDMCTGSGCVAISVARYLDGARVAAADISAEALLIARKNADRHRLADRISFYCGDMFEALPPASELFDVICANPPYIPSGELSSLPPDVVSYEPLQALDGGRDGLEYYRILAERAAPYMADGGFLCAEAGIGQAGAVMGVFAAKNWRCPCAIKDLAGVERVVCARRPDNSLLP
jgi:release factor glutamine methyltransferase